MFAQREYDFYFYVKRDCLLFSVNVKLFFEFFVMLLLRESVFRRGIGETLWKQKRAKCVLGASHPQYFADAAIFSRGFLSCHVYQRTKRKRPVVYRHTAE